MNKSNLKIYLSGKNRFRLKTDDLIQALKSCNKFSKGPDGIPFIYYQKVIPCVIDHFSYLFSITLENCHCPNEWTHSYLTPILKKSKDPKDALSYRPLNMPSSMLKIFEKLILSYLNFNVKNNISISQHYAFKHRSTITNLIEFTSVIYSNFEARLDTYTAYLDFFGCFRLRRYFYFVPQTY